jgi:hypothetical protein
MSEIDIEEIKQIVRANAIGLEKLREESKETDRRMKETDRKISKLGSRIGELIEHLTASNLLDKFSELGYAFTKIYRNVKIEDVQNRRLLAEADLVLENGDYVMVVEVKSLLSKGDVKEQIKRLETLRAHADGQGDSRKYTGAVAGALIEKTARDYALESGFYVIEQTGDRVSIKEPAHLRTW